MLSLRQLRNRQTTGGVAEYRINPDDFERLVTLLNESRTKHEMRLLLRSLLTGRELADIVRRITVAKLIERGMNYDQIVKITGAARSTVSLVNNALKINKGMFHQILHRAPLVLNATERAILRHFERGQ